MKHLKLFQTADEYKSFIKGNLSIPNVSFIRESGEVKYMNELPESSSVYIQHRDGSLYTVREWTDKGFVSSDANGVAVIDDKAQFVIAKTHAGNPYTCTWADDTTNAMSGVFTTTDLSVAEEDYDGSQNTGAIINHMMDTAGKSAAERCEIYEGFPGSGTGYLPSVGEWMIASKYKAEIDEAMRVLGTSLDKGENLWASTQGSANTAWRVFWGTDNFSGEGFSCHTTDKSIVALPWAFSKLIL